jgi:CBS domain-containing protein
MVTIGELMKRSLVTVPAETSVVEAAQVMEEYNIGSVFVERDDRVVGIVTEPDIVRKVVGAGLPAYYTHVEHIMSTPVICIDERRPITEAAHLMQQHHTRHLGVLQSGRIVGVLSVRDLLQPVAVDHF